MHLDLDFLFKKRSQRSNQSVIVAVSLVPIPRAYNYTFSVQSRTQDVLGKQTAIERFGSVVFCACTQAVTRISGSHHHITRASTAFNSIKAIRNIRHYMN